MIDCLRKLPFYKSLAELKDRHCRKKLAKRWRKDNKHNFTEQIYPFNVEDASVGIGTYGFLNVRNAGTKSILKIGNYCSIADEVVFLLGVEHSTNLLSMYPFKVKCLGERFEASSKGNIVVDDDVWIGYGATIMSGVHIGQGAVVAAGAVVTKDVPPYAIMGGVPAKIIKYRFSEEIIEKLLKIDFSKLTKEQIKEHIGDLYTPVTENTNFDWLPKKK